MEKKRAVFANKGFAVTPDYCGLFDLDKWPVRNMFEDLGLLRGWATCEIMEAEGNTVFHFEDHFKRLCSSVTKLKMPNPEGAGGFFIVLKKFLGDAIKEVLSANSLKTSLVYVLVTAGHTSDLFHADGSSNIFILAKPFSFVRFREGHALKLKTINWAREFPGVKTTNYLAAELASSIPGYDDILYASNGIITESSRANFFLVCRTGNSTVIKTAQDDILRGVTRKIVLDLVRKEGCQIDESEICLDSVRDADEAFVSSTTLGVWPVAKVDLILLPLSFGAVTGRLRRSFFAYRRDWYNRALAVISD